MELTFIKLYILFLCFISCKNLKTEDIFLDDNTKNTKSFTKTNYLKVSFKPDFIINSECDYLNIHIKNYNENKLGQLAFFSKSNKDCMQNREQMSINPYGDSFMSLRYIFSDDHKDYDKYRYDSFYICVYCLDVSLCNYAITFELNNATNIPNNINFYNFYFYDDLYFSFESNQNINNMINENNNIYELYWIKRMNNNKFINFNYSLPKEYNGILLKNITNENIDFNISTYIGDFVTAGRSIIIGNNSYESLKINDIETIGYLDKEILTEECFVIENLEEQPINNLYIRGIIYDKIAQIYYKELNSENIIGEKRIIEGNFIEKLTEDQIESGIKICVSFVDDSNNEYESYNNITFLIQLFSNEIKNYYYYFNNIYIPGSLYVNSLSYDEIMVIPGIITNNNKISITVNTIYGIPKIYLDECKKHPFCKYEEVIDIANLDKVNINKIQDYSHYFRNKEEINYLDSYQPLLIIHCPIENGCWFEINYFIEDDFIILKEDVLFNQNILKDEKNNFIIDFKNNNNVIQIILDLIIFNGNIDLNLKYKEKFFILNKFVYILKLIQMNY